jgi:protein O-GlcNAc transferase
MTSQSDPPDLRMALRLHQAGQVGPAADIYREILTRNPNNTDALHYLGLLESRAGNFEHGTSLIARSLQLQPSNIQFRENYATILYEARRYELAIEICDEELRANPRSVYLLYISASALFKLKRLPESLEAFDKLLALQPDHLVAINERGTVLAQMGEYEKALVAFQKAISLNPRFPDAHLHRGNLLGELDRHDEAKLEFEKALALNPRLARAWSGLGITLRERYLFDEALAAFDKALALESDLVEAWLGRGNVYASLKLHDNALTAYDRALRLKPDLAQAWFGRGNVYASLKQYDNALAAYDRALSLQPDLAQAWFGRGNVYASLKQYEKALSAYDQALGLEHDLTYALANRLYTRQLLCDWTNIESEIDQVLSTVRNQQPFFPFNLLLVLSSPKDQWQCAKVFAAHQRSFPPLWRGEIYSHSRIRIAYLSADFHEHATAYLTVGLFEKHDKNRFEVYAISAGPNDNSDIRLRIARAVDHFIDVQDKSDEEIAQLIRRSEIDLLVDLKGWTYNARNNVLPRRAAPLQVNYLGYPGTMGADYVDYIIADQTIIPKEQFPYYSERVVWLPDTYQVNDSRRPISEHALTREECDLPAAAFVFCCFNNPYKILPDMFDIWMRLLQRTEGSVLWLFEDHPTASANLRREAEGRGVSPKRLVFAQKIPLPDHLARHRHADLFLDTIPCTAHTTASDALWAGLPIVTCLGETFAGRVAASLLRAIGLPELVTASLKEYESLALKLANDPALLQAVKAKLAQNRERCPLFDTARFTRHIEAAYVRMWERYQRGDNPEVFTVRR